MFLKNYTSTVPVSQTIHRIEQVLIKCGVSGIAKEYIGTEGQIAAITFKLHGSPSIQVRLPADVNAAKEALWSDYVNGDKLTPDGNRLAWNSYKKKSKADFTEQAAKTAWKIIQDWVEVQMSMIQLKQAEPLEVFLPYAWDGQRTFYQQLKTAGFRAMLPPIPEKEP